MLHELFNTAKLGPTWNLSFNEGGFLNSLSLLSGSLFGGYTIRLPALFVVMATQPIQLVQTRADATLSGDTIVLPDGSSFTFNAMPLPIFNNIYWPIMVQSDRDSLLVFKEAISVPGISITAGSSIQVAVTLVSQLGPLTDPVGGTVAGPV